MKALGRENIDEVIKLSEDYKADSKPHISFSVTVSPSPFLPSRLDILNLVKG